MSYICDICGGFNGLRFYNEFALDLCSSCKNDSKVIERIESRLSTLSIIDKFIDRDIIILIDNKAEYYKLIRTNSQIITAKHNDNYFFIPVNNIRMISVDSHESLKILIY